MAKRVTRWLAGVVVIGGGLLALSNGWKDPWMWTYIAVVAACGTYAMCVIDDDLARERFRPPSAGADRLSLRIIRLIALAHLVIGALDSGRWHIGEVPAFMRVVGLAGFAVSFVWMVHAMRANRFFSPVVRIQHERGHHLVDTGPYAHIRHPGYAGMLPSMAMSALALGSWVSFGLSLIYAGLILRRVMFEDAFLHANLTGYPEYARRVPYRLLPGIW